MYGCNLQVSLTCFIGIFLTYCPLLFFGVWPAPCWQWPLAWLMLTCEIIKSRVKPISSLERHVGLWQWEHTCPRWCSITAEMWFQAGRCQGTGPTSLGTHQWTLLGVLGLSASAAPLWGFSWCCPPTTCAAFSNKMLHCMVKKYEKLTARPKSCDYQTKRWGLFSEMLIILTQGSPPP